MQEESFYLRYTRCVRFDDREDDGHDRYDERRRSRGNNFRRTKSLFRLSTPEFPRRRKKETQFRCRDAAARRRKKRRRPPRRDTSCPAATVAAAAAGRVAAGTAETAEWREG